MWKCDMDKREIPDRTVMYVYATKCRHKENNDPKKKKKVASCWECKHMKPDKSGING